MKFKKLGLLLSFVPLLLTSCSAYGTHYVVRDLDSYYSDSLFRDFSFEKIDQEMASNKEFLVLLASTGCSACEAFMPEFSAFLEERHYLTYIFDAHDNQEMADQIIEIYKGKFAKQDANGNYYLSFPSLFLIKGDNSEEIPFLKLKNKTMIANTFNEYVHNCNVFFAEGNAINNMMNHSSKIPFREFGYLAFDFSNEDLFSYFKESLQSFVNDASFPIVVTNYEEVEGYIAVKKGTITDDGSYGSKAETLSNKETDNLSYVKEVLNK